jgi:uncharacterized protein YbjT (DUF2867 family)
MTKILVTGGTGVLGREIVRRLAGRADVRVLSRKDAPMENAEVVRGDLETGAGIDAAVAGVDVIVHAASNGTDFRRQERDLEATRCLLAAVRGTPHIVYISIVGIDAVPNRYYGAKLTVERMIAESGLPWTVLRTTQFHELVVMFLSVLARGPIAVVPRGFRVQPVDTGEVAERLADLALGEPAGRVPDMGGPRVERLDDLMRAYLETTHRRRPILRIPLPGRQAAAVRAGHHLTPGNATGLRTFADDLRDRVDENGRIAPPYDLKRR